MGSPGEILRQTGLGPVAHARPRPSPNASLWVERLRGAIIGAAEIAAVAFLVMDVVVLLWSVVARYVFNSPIVWAEEVASLCFLWLAMLGSVIALARGEHMAMSTVVEMLPARRRAPVRLFADVLGAAFLATMIAPAFLYVRDNLIVTTPVLGISESWRLAAVAIVAPR